NRTPELVLAPGAAEQPPSMELVVGELPPPEPPGLSPAPPVPVLPPEPPEPVSPPAEPPVPPLPPAPPEPEVAPLQTSSVPTGWLTQPCAQCWISTWLLLQRTASVLSVVQFQKFHASAQVQEPPSFSKYWHHSQCRPGSRWLFAPP